MNKEKMLALAVGAAIACVPEITGYAGGEVADYKAFGGKHHIGFEWEWGLFPNPFSLDPPSIGVTEIATMSSFDNSGEGSSTIVEDTLYTLKVGEDEATEVIVRLHTDYDTGTDDNHRGVITVWFPGNAISRAILIAKLKTDIYADHLTNLIPQPQEVTQLMTLASRPEELQSLLELSLKVFPKAKKGAA